jgi:hypothetical protein
MADPQTTRPWTIPSSDFTPAMVDQLREDEVQLRRRLAHISMVAAMALAGNADKDAALKAIQKDAREGSDHGR